MTHYPYRFIFVVVLVNFSMYLYAQNEFNKVIRYDDNITRNEIICEVDDAYYTIGYSDDISGHTVGIHVSKHDKNNGGVLNNTYFAIDSTWSFLEQSFDVFYKENSLIFGLEGDGLLYKLEYDLSTNHINILDSVSFPIDDPGLFQHDMLIFNDTTLYVATYSLEVDSFKYGLFFTYPNGTRETKHITRTDSLTGFGQMIKRDNGNYVLFGSMRGGNVFWDRSLAIYEYDRDLNVLSKFFTPKTDGYIRVENFLPIGDQEVLLLVSKYDWDEIRSTYAFSHSILRYHLDDREILWSKNYGFPASSGLSGGRIVASHEANHFLYGTVAVRSDATIDSFSQVGRVVKVDDEGEQIWQRDYSFFNARNDENNFHDIIATSDGQYLLGGVARGMGRFHGWLLKINESGEVVGDSLVNVQWTESDWTADIQIYPNPTIDHIYINQNKLDHVTYQLYDIQGNFIHSLDVSGQDQGVVWDVSDLVSGSYFIRMLKDGVIIGSSVLIKQDE